MLVTVNVGDNYEILVTDHHSLVVNVTVANSTAHKMTCKDVFLNIPRHLFYRVYNNFLEYKGTWTFETFTLFRNNLLER